MTLVSVVNRGEYLSNHYLDVMLQGDLRDARRRWDEAEAKGLDTARSRLRAVSRQFFAAKTRVAESGAPEDLRAMHDVVLTALGFPPDRRELVLERGGEKVAVPAAAVCETHTGLLLVALDLGELAVDVDKALDPEEAGRLLAPVRVGERTLIADATDAVAHLFAADEPPRWALLLAGGVVILADRAKWGEGRFLAADLDLALSRGDRHELETVAALFSADALVPEEGQSVLDKLAESSHKHAVGVSKDLREGVRRSVEILAGEVIRQRLAAKLRVYEEPRLAKELTRQCLRFLYRLLFLLYAEARPELEILPLDHPEYTEGYGLDRLRDLALANLTSDKARDGAHVHESLKLLFRLVNEGYHHEAAQAVLMAGEVSEDVGLKSAGAAAAAAVKGAAGPGPRLRLLCAARHQPARRGVRRAHGLHRVLRHRGPLRGGPPRPGGPRHLGGAGAAGRPVRGGVLRHPPEPGDRPARAGKAPQGLVRLPPLRP